MRPRIRTWWFAFLADRDRLAFATGFLLLLPFYWTPLFVTRYLPGLDLPFHISMVDMLGKEGHRGSPYQRYYGGELTLAPYTAYYLSLWLVGKLVALTTAHKIVVAVYVAGMPLCVARLLGACGRSLVPALLAFPLAYNLTLHYGFISFAISIPIVLLLLAEVARFLLARRFRPHLWLTSAAAALLLFLGHLQNFLFGVCASIAFVLFSGAPWRRRLQGLVAFVPAALALTWWQLTASFTGEHQEQRKSLWFALQAVKAARMSDFGSKEPSIVADVLRRFDEVALHTLRGFADGIDIRASRTLIVLIVFYGLLGLWALRAPRCSDERPRLRLAGCIACFGALLAYMTMPHHLTLFELTTFYPRFAALLVVMTLLLIPASLRRLGGSLRVMVPLPAIAFCAFYGRELVRHYAMFGEEVADFGAVVDKVPPGQKIMGLVYDRQSRVMRIESVLLGLPNYYVADKPAMASMTPLLYCGMRHIPCRLRQPMTVLPYEFPWVPDRMVPDKAVPFFDYFLVRSGPEARKMFGATHVKNVELVAQQGTWKVYRRFPGLPTALEPRASELSRWQGPRL